MLGPLVAQEADEGWAPLTSFTTSSPPMAHERHGTESLPPVRVGVGDDDGVTEQERVRLGLGLLFVEGLAIFF